MLRLDTVNRSLRIVLAAAITTNNLPVKVNYSDDNGPTYTGGSQLSNSNGVTAVTICAAPASGTVRDIDYVSVYNADTVSATVTIQVLDTATVYIERKVTLQVGDMLEYTHGKGWQVMDSSGNIKTAQVATTATVQNIDGGAAASIYAAIVAVNGGGA